MISTTINAVLLGIGILCIQEVNGQIREDDVSKYIGGLKSVATLADSLKSPSRDIRVYSAIRLGELGDETAIEPLKLAYEREPYETLDDGGFGVKYHALRSIGKIGGSDTRNYLMALVMKLNSTRNSDGKLQYLGNKFEEFQGAFEALAERPDSNAMALLLNVFNTNDLDYAVRRRAFEAYLMLYLKSSQFSDLRDTLLYLLNQNKAITVTNKYIGVIPSDETLKKRSYEYLTILYAEKDPTILSAYKNGLPSNDPFIEEVSSMESTVIQIINEKSSILRIKEKIEAQNK